MTLLMIMTIQSVGAFTARVGILRGRLSFVHAAFPLSYDDGGCGRGGSAADFDEL